MLCHVVNMDCRGLVDPHNKPFGRVLPLEVQIRIMFWVECFYTIDKRKKVVQEFKELPQCSLISLVEPSDNTLACPPEKWLPPLQSHFESPVIGKGKIVLLLLWMDGMETITESLFLVCRLA